MGVLRLTELRTLTFMIYEKPNWDNFVYVCISNTEYFVVTKIETFICISGPKHPNVFFLLINNVVRSLVICS